MPAITVHPTPQNRHCDDVYVTAVSANTCSVFIPAMVTAAAAADALIKFRLSSFIPSLLFSCFVTIRFNYMYIGFLLCRNIHSGLQTLTQDPYS
jgi:hypothetical protein